MWLYLVYVSYTSSHKISVISSRVVEIKKDMNGSNKSIAKMSLVSPIIAAVSLLFHFSFHVNLHFSFSKHV